MINRIESQPVSQASPDQRISWVTAFQNFFTHRPPSRAWSFCLVRALSLANLFVNVRGQLYPAQLELSSLNNRDGWILNGMSSGERSGGPVVSAGDINNDGAADFVIGAHKATPQPGRENAGRAYIVFGRKGLGQDGVFDLAKLNGTNGFILNGDRGEDQCCTAMFRANDINGDGIDDLLIGSYRADLPSGRENAGKTYVLFGRKNLGTEGVLELSSLMGSDGFVLNGERNPDQSGWSVASGDLNDDGTADLFIGAYRAPGGDNFGKTYVVFGKPGLGNSGSLELSSLDGRDGFVIDGEQRGDRSSGSIANAGDVNGDGVNDLLIGADGADVFGGRDDAGKIYVVFGKVGIGATGSLQLSGLGGPDGFKIHGVTKGDGSGGVVAWAGDVNADGVDDFLIGAPNISKTYVVFGQRQVRAGGVLELSSLNGANGFVILGEASGDRSGSYLSGGDDFNGDGIADILVGAPKASITVGRVAGKAYVVFGRPGLGASGSLELYRLNGTNGFILNGEGDGDECGGIFAGDDVNADGIPDLFVGANWADPASDRLDAGRSYVVFGRRPITTTRFSPPTTTSLATSATTLPSSTTRLASTTVPLTTLPSTTTEKTSTAASSTPRLDSSESLSLDLPIGIGGGVCAVISSVASALIVWKCRRKHNSSTEVELDYASQGYQQPPAGSSASTSREAQSSYSTTSPNQNRYNQLQLRPDGKDHPISINNRAHEPGRYQSQLPIHHPNDRSHYKGWEVIEEENQQRRQEEVHSL